MQTDRGLATSAIQRHVRLARSRARARAPFPLEVVVPLRAYWKKTCCLKVTLVKYINPAFINDWDP